MTMGISGGGETGCTFCSASSLRMSWLTKSEESSPHCGQTNLIGCAISGVTSSAYFAPQEHWIFMASRFGIQ